MNEYRNVILQGDVRARLLELPDCSVQCIVTSPPYWGLRDYGAEGQLGLERTPEEYIAKMVKVFAEVKRVLRDDGTLWLNMGDSYAQNGKAATREELGEDADRAKERGYATQAFAGYDGWNRAANTAVSGLKPKDLCGIPWAVAFALRADGWYLRQDIIWSKPNPMPESVTDRCTKSHEYIFLMSKKAKYYYDAEAVKEKATYPGDLGIPRGATGIGSPYEKQTLSYSDDKANSKHLFDGSRNRRSVWNIATAPFSGAHFATFPPKLVEPCILAGTSERGVCAQCGKPWERVTEPSAEYAKKLGTWTPDTDADPQLRAEIGFAAHGKKEACCADYKTLGWKPACKCYGLEIIGAQPVKPSQTHRNDDDEEEVENPKSYAARLKNYEEAIAKWYADWQRLQPLYQAQTAIVPAVVLDCFFGAGTVGLVAKRLLRDWIGIELNEEYIKMAQKRIDNEGEMLPLEAL